MAYLKTDYKDDILNAGANKKRKYRMIQNDDGTVSFEDATVYAQVGDSFGAGDVNLINTEVNARLKEVNIGYSSDINVMPYYTFKRYWGQIPVGSVCGRISYGTGIYFGYKDSESYGMFLIQARHDLSDDDLRISGGTYILKVTNSIWTLEKITTENLFFE